jgi:hypothetical protein
VFAQGVGEDRIRKLRYKLDCLVDLALGVSVAPAPVEVQLVLRLLLNCNSNFTLGSKLA